MSSSQEMTEVRRSGSPRDRPTNAVPPIPRASRPRHQIAVVPGDGIGPEVTAAALDVLEAVAGRDFVLDLDHHDLGAERYISTGEVLPDSVVQQFSSLDAVFLGAVGDPRVPPGVLERGLLLRLRRELDLYVNLRPARLFPRVPAPLKSPGNIDVVVVRENTEGPYAEPPEGPALGEGDEVSVNTEGAVSRIVDYAFEEAERRGGPVTLVHKENVLQRAGGLYRRVFDETARDHPDVETRYQHADSAALTLVLDPARFSVIVTDNLFGDILSDLLAAAVGGLGWVASANLHPGKTSMFEPVHGSAPDIAGQGRANPAGAILSAALMLRHLGEEDAALRVERAVEECAPRIAEGAGTRRAGEIVAEAAS